MQRDGAICRAKAISRHDVGVRVHAKEFRSADTRPLVANGSQFLSLSLSLPSIVTENLPDNSSSWRLEVNRALAFPLIERRFERAENEDKFTTLCSSKLPEVFSSYISSRCSPRIGRMKALVDRAMSERSRLTSPEEGRSGEASMLEMEALRMPRKRPRLRT